MKSLWNQYTRGTAIVIIASALTCAALYINYDYVNKRVQTKNVLVPKEHIIPFGSLKENLTTREVVVSEIASDAILDLKEIQDQEWFAGGIGLTKGMPIRKSMITNAKDSPFGLALTIKPGNHLIGVQSDQYKSAGDFIKAGVLVDAVVYIKGDQQRRAQTITSKENPNLKELLVRDRQNQEGITTGTKEGKSMVTSVAILEVNEAQAMDLVQYQEEGKVYLLPVGVDKGYIDTYLKENAQKNEATKLLTTDLNSAAK
ncbi:RcpC/CpaB family pilus assembly protein [Paenibacillus agricola]|uniref:Flp pilus assembly protein RcpC/CpaB domain-containing protein n=1 Tax=Paenibacillus agricola TaxID=2716264 RepID=A0ABX0JEC2_9BACL|nr:RcpC/CpaB family pilus assembly protein [Paenibacillus agricola]NHN34882.1 hypothetical protein [Paenibacillus agricola]